MIDDFKTIFVAFSVFWLHCSSVTLPVTFSVLHVFSIAIFLVALLCEVGHSDVENQQRKSGFVG